MKAAIDKSIIEKIKSMMIVVLLISTILLLYFFWGDFSLEDFNLIDNQTDIETIDIKDVIEPEQMIVSLGEDSYKLVSKDKWQEMVQAIKEFAQADTLVVEEITKDQYEKVMQSNSIRGKFGYQISLSEFFAAYEIKGTAAFDAIKTLTEIGYGGISKESLLLYDSVAEKYFRIITTQEGKLLEEFLILQREEDGPIYFTVDTYLGGAVNNRTLIPISLETNLYDFKVQREDYSDQADKVSTIAQSFFGKTFDFVRKIEEGNGTVIYMYGYGQKVLIINKDGVIEYKEEATGENSPVGYLDSLKTALNFIAAHGAFESSNGSPYKPYLKKVEINQDKQDSYRFTFGVEVNNHKVSYQSKAPMVIEIVKNQVTYFSRDLMDYDSISVETKASNYKEAYSAINMLAQNYNYFKSEMGMVGTFEEIANNIISIEPGYVIAREKEGISENAKAAWIVSFNGTEAFFDLYTTEPIGFGTSEN